MFSAALVAAIALALLHLFAGDIRVPRGAPRSIGLSVAGGISVAYVFVHLLPEVGRGTEVLHRAAGGIGEPPTRPYGFIVALAGLVTFYGIEHVARTKKKRGAGSTAGEGRAVFWVHVGTFGLYNALIGHLLLHGRRDTIGALALFAVAMGLHFVVNDYGLEEHHQELYERRGRWILAAAVVAGLGVGMVVRISEPVQILLLAFLAGAVVMNVLKEELPAERESRFWAFLAGVVGYTAVLLAV